MIIHKNEAQPVHTSNTASIGLANRNTMSSPCRTADICARSRSCCSRASRSLQGSSISPIRSRRETPAGPALAITWTTRSGSGNECSWCWSQVRNLVWVIELFMRGRLVLGRVWFDSVRRVGRTDSHMPGGGEIGGGGTVHERGFCPTSFAPRTRHGIGLHLRHSRPIRSCTR